MKKGTSFEPVYFFESSIIHLEKQTRNLEHLRKLVKYFMFESIPTAPTNLNTFSMLRQLFQSQATPNLAKDMIPHSMVLDNYNKCIGIIFTSKLYLPLDPVAATLVKGVLTRVQNTKTINAVRTKIQSTRFNDESLNPFQTRVLADKLLV